MELLSVDKPVVELCVPDPDQELGASVGVGLPLDENDDADSRLYLAMAFCTFFVKWVGKGSLLFTAKLCFPDPSDSPLPRRPSSESLSEAHSSPMSGKVKNRVLGPGPGGTRALGSLSPGQGGRGFRGLEVTVLLMLLPAEPPMDGYAAQTAPGPGGGRATTTRWAGEPAELRPPLEGAGGRAKERGRGEDPTLAAPGLLGSEAGVSTASAGRPATETRAWGAASRGWSATSVGCSRTEGPRELDGESGARAGRTVKVRAALSEVPGRERAAPTSAAPREGLEEATGEGAAGGAVEVLKILAKRDPRSNTATFMSWP